MKQKVKSKKTIAAPGRKAGRSAERAAETKARKPRAGATKRVPSGEAPCAEARPAALSPGTVITRSYKGREIRVTVLDAGFRWDGEAFRSLTAVALRVTGYPAISGPHFFRIGVRSSAAPKAAKVPFRRNAEEATPAPTDAPIDGAASAG